MVSSVATVSGGHVAARVSRPATDTHTWAHRAPVPSASSRAIRAGRSSVDSASGMLAANRLSTSYGAAEWLPSRRDVHRSMLVCTRANDNATVAVASTDRAMLGESVRPMIAPAPRTTAT